MTPLATPLTSALVAAALTSYFGLRPSFATAAESSQFGGTVASIGVTMLGFMLAALAVLASINHTQLVAMMRKTGAYHDLLATLFVGCAMFLLCAGIGYVLLFGFVPPDWVYIMATAVHVGALASLVDVGRKFWLVLRNLKA